MGQDEKKPPEGGVEALRLDLSRRIDHAIYMVAAPSVLGVNRLHPNAKQRKGMMSPVRLDEMIEGDDTRPEVIGLSFLANVHKELLALLPPEALTRLQTALQCEQFFALEDLSPHGVHRFPESAAQIQALLAQPPGKLVVLPPSDQ